MLSTPANLCLPSGSSLAEDADEEIFLIYTNKQQSQAEESPNDTGGLGFHSSHGDVLNLSLTIENPWLPSVDQNDGKKRAKGKKSKEKGKDSFEVEVEVHQSLDNLRNRKGDTGSVLWRLSLHLAKYLLRSHIYPHSSHPPLLPNLSTSTILELGSGTGYLGLALRSIFSSTTTRVPPNSTSRSSSTFSPPTIPFEWTFSDQLENLSLVLRNLHANGVPPSLIGDSPSQPYSIVELDWLVESQAYLAKKPLS
ncbi:hypothetical protein JCM5353_005757, partial [Sporobolomyces roseus]